MPKTTLARLRVAVLAALLGAQAMSSAAPAVDEPLPESSADFVTRLFSGHAGPTMQGVAGDGLLARMRGQASDMVATALGFIGVPYRRGGTSAEQGFDCSGFTRRVFESSLGLLLPRRADEQARTAELRPVDREALQPGDLVFFNTLRRTFSHVGIYVGDHKFVHSPRRGAEVRVDDMRFGYWAQRYTGARRADRVAEPATEAQTAPVR